MPSLILTNRTTFSASHRLHSAALSAEENRKLFGKCNWDNGHGHNYVLKVSVKGRPDPKTGLFINLFDLETIVREKLLDAVDHRHLNLDIPHFKDVNPTAENIAVYCWNVLAKHLPPGSLYEIYLEETETCSVTYRGEA